MIADTGKHSTKNYYFGKESRIYSEVYLKVFQQGYITLELLFHQAFY